MPVAVTHTLCLPTTDLVHYVRRTLYSAKAVSHRVAEAMHCAALWNHGLQPLVEGGASCVGVRLLCSVVAREGKCSLWVLRQDALGGPQGRPYKRNLTSTGRSLQPTPWMLSQLQVGDLGI